MKRVKKTLLAGAGVAAISISSFGLASAATSSSSANPDDSLAQKIASKFNLNKNDVQSVIDQDRSDHVAEMKTKRADALKQAVTDGKLTQAQADHITAAWKEIDTLMGTTKPSDRSDATRQQIRDKIKELRTWLKDQNINLSSIDGLGGPGFGHHGPGGFGGPRDDDSSDDSSSN